MIDTSVIYLTVEELAEKAGVPKMRVREHVKEGLLDSILGQDTGFTYRKAEQTGLCVNKRTCSRVLFHPDEVDAYVELMKDYEPEDKRKVNGKKRGPAEGTKTDKGLACALAAKYCGVTDSTIRAAVKAGHLKALNIKPLRISEYIIEKYKEELDDRVNLRQAAGMLNISVSAVRSMVENGRLEQVFPHMGMVYLSRRAVVEHLKKFNETHELRGYRPIIKKG